LHEARQVILTLKALEKAHKEAHQYTAILASVKDDLSQYCQQFAEIFFHGASKGKTWMCPAKIIQVILIVFAAILTIATFAFGSLPPIGEMLYAGTYPLSEQLYIWLDNLAITGIYRGHAIVIQRLSDRLFWYANHRWIPWVARHFEAWTGAGEVIDGFNFAKRDTPEPEETEAQKNLDAAYESKIPETFAGDRDIYIGRDPNYPSWGTFGIFETFRASQLRADDDGSSVYEQTDVKAVCKWKTLFDYPYVYADMTASFLVLFRRFPLEKAFPEFKTHIEGICERGEQSPVRSECEPDTDFVPAH
jgi:hypothetical protein